MKKTYTFTEEELQRKCRMAFLLSALRMVILSNVESEKKPEEFDKIVEDLFQIFTEKD